MLTIIIAVASCAALCLCISVCIYVRRNKKTVEALQDVLVAVMTAKKAEQFSKERSAVPGGPNVTFAPGLQLDTKRRCSTKNVDAKLTRSLSNKAVRMAIKTAEVMNAEAGESDVDTPNPDPSSAASSPGVDAPGRYTSRRGRDSFAEDLTMEAASKSELPSGRMTPRAVPSGRMTTTRAAAVHLAAKLRRRDGGDESRRGPPPPAPLPMPGAVGSGKFDHNHGIDLEEFDSRPASLEASPLDSMPHSHTEQEATFTFTASPLDSAFRRSSVAKFFSSDEDGEGAEDVGAGAGFRLGLSPRAAPSCVPLEAEPARSALMRRTSSIKITKQSLAILSDEEQKVFKKAMGKLGTVERDFVLDVDATFLEQALSPQLLGGDFAQPSFRDVEKPKLDETPVDETPDAGRDEPSALELFREARSQPPPAPLKRAATPAPKPARPKFVARGSRGRVPTPPADGANTSTCGAPFGAKLKPPQGVQRRQLTGLPRAGSQKNLASSATRLTSEPGSSDVAAQAAGASPGKVVQKV